MTFSYTATDYQTFTVQTASPMTVVVRTTVIVVANPNAAPAFQGPTNTFTIRLKPPQAQQPQLMQAYVEGQVVNLNVMRSNLDGEMEATVEVPISAGKAPAVKVDWQTKDYGVVEDTVQVDSQVTVPKLHASRRPNNILRVTSLSKPKLRVV